jgi:hypothetical protein
MRLSAACDAGSLAPGIREANPLRGRSDSIARSRWGEWKPSGLAGGILAAGFNPRGGAITSLLLIACLLSGCSGCTDGHGATDAGTDTSTADGDTDTDADGDTDTDTDTLPEGFVPDAGPGTGRTFPTQATADRKDAASSRSRMR